MSALLTELQTVIKQLMPASDLSLHFVDKRSASACIYVVCS